MKHPPLLRLFGIALLLATGACAATPAEEGGTGGYIVEGSGGHIGPGGNPGSGGDVAGSGGKGSGGVVTGSGGSGTGGWDPSLPASKYCQYPAKATQADVLAAYATWKAARVTSSGAGGGLRVTRDEAGTNNDTVSEGIGYGMILSVFANDKTTFDGLWKYAKAHSNNGLMDWKITSGGSVASDGGGPASDADEDMAWALLVAEKKWNSSTYGDEGRNLVRKILQDEVTGGNELKPGRWGDNTRNPSYLAPAYYRVFQTATNEPRWGQVVTSSYAILSRSAHATTGLVPNWINHNVEHANEYAMEACRVPWRLVLDYCISGDANAKARLDKLNAFFSQYKGSPTGIRAGYNLDGTPTANYTNLAFVGPAVAGQMAGGSKEMLDRGFKEVLALAKSGKPYYGSTVAMVSLFVMVGFWN